MKVQQLIALSLTITGCASKSPDLQELPRNKEQRTDVLASRYCQAWDGGALRANERLELVSIEEASAALDTEMDETTINRSGSFYIIKPIYDDIEDFRCN